MHPEVPTSPRARPSARNLGEAVIELFAADARVDEVRSTIEGAIPAYLPPEAVLSFSAAPGGVRVVAGEPISDMQRAALDAVRARWPSAA